MLKVLLVIEQCNPRMISVPLVGYHLYCALAKKARVTLCTHGRNKEALEELHKGEDIVYFDESTFSSGYYHFFSKVLPGGTMNWPLFHLLFYPIYAEFNRKVYKAFHKRVEEGEYDVVHAFSPVIPRYPVKLVKACKKAPFILGPVNGGMPFPKGFEDIADKEAASWNWFRDLAFLLPGYRETYRKATLLLAGSSYTLALVKEMFPEKASSLRLLFENGLTPSFFRGTYEEKDQKGYVEILFVGRLVPCKGVDILLNAIHRLEDPLRKKFRVTIVGDGSDRKELEKICSNLGLNDIVTFVGWVANEETVNYYARADIFCFPSIREFGGAVVMEAMANALVCLIINYGGMAEYVTEGTGFKLALDSPEALIAQLAEKLTLLIENPNLRRDMGIKARERARDFAWDKKADHILSMYREVLNK